jgi:hypothetical protein
MRAVAVAVVIALCVGCGGAHGRVGEVRGAPSPWDLWIPPAARSVYVRIREPVGGAYPVCPGAPWGIVERYRLNRDGRVDYPEPHDYRKAVLERAIKQAHAGRRPRWMTAYERKCEAAGS